jgi:hypothetical protein
MVQRITLTNEQTMDGNEVVSIAVALIQIGLIFGFVGSFICLLWSFVQWGTEKKDEEKRARAKRRILWSFVGLVATFVIYFILSVLLGILGVGTVQY